MPNFVTLQAGAEAVKLPLMTVKTILGVAGPSSHTGLGVRSDGFVKDALARTRLVDSLETFDIDPASRARALDGSFLHGPSGRVPTTLDALERRPFLLNAFRFAGPEMRELPATLSPMHNAIEESIQGNRLILSPHGISRYFHAGATGVGEEPGVWVAGGVDARHLFPDDFR